MTDLAPPRFLDRSSPPHIATLVTMTGLSALAMSIFLPSLPAMAAHFGTEYHVMQLSVAVYLGMNALLQVLVGPVSDRFGRRVPVLAGIAIFLVATLGCLFAPNAQVFLLCRMAQASVVVALALGRAVVRDMYDQSSSASMLGYVTMGMSLVPMLGPVLGGVLDRAFGWQASFWALFVAGLVVGALVWWDMGETGGSRGRRFRDQLAEYPELLTSPRFWGYTVTAALSSGAFFAYVGGAPFVGTEVFGLSPMQVGLGLGVPATGYFFGNWISGRYSQRVGVDRMVLAGSLVVSSGLGLSLALFAAGHGSAASFFSLMTCVGFGNGMVLPNATAGSLSVRPQLAATASGLGGFLQIGGGAALSALAGRLLVPGAGAMPLLWIMFGTAAASVLTSLFVIARTRQVEG